MKLSSVLRFISVAALLSFASAQAQLLNAFGVKAGINSSTSNIELRAFGGESLDTKRRTGIHAAIFAEWLKLPVFSVVTQVEYAQRGFIDEIPVTGEDSPELLGYATSNTRLDYLSVPMLLKLKIPGASILPYVLAGPRFDFLVNREAGNYELGNMSFPNLFAPDFKDQTTGGTVGLGMTTGKALLLPLLLELRYNFDFNDSADTRAIRAKNNSVDVWLGIML